MSTIPPCKLKTPFAGDADIETSFVAKVVFWQRTEPLSTQRLVLNTLIIHIFLICKERNKN